MAGNYRQGLIEFMRGCTGHFYDTGKPFAQAAFLVEKFFFG